MTVDIYVTAGGRSWNVRGQAMRSGATWYIDNIAISSDDTGDIRDFLNEAAIDKIEAALLEELTETGGA